MIKVKTEEDLKNMRIACKITGDTLKYIETKIRPGISTKELDNLAYDFIKSKGAKPSFKGYGGFPGSVCTSINEVVVHGIPSESRILQEGDIISIDVGAKYNGFHGDAARTFPVGKIDSKVARLIKVTEKSLNSMRDISNEGTSF